MMTRAMPVAATTRINPALPPQRVSKKRRRGTAPLLLALLGLLILASLAWAGYSLLQDRQAEQKLPQISVPNLVGMSLDEARDEVGDDFDLEVEKSVEGERPVDTILNQDPSTGKVEKGSKISLTVVGTQVAGVPNVVGTERAAAEQTLRDAGFEVQVDERESSVDDDGRVMSQDPGSGTRVEVGSGVTITVGTGPSSVEVPRLYGNTPAQAESLLQQTGLKLGTQNRDYSDEVAEGSIFYQDPSAGQNVEPGTAVNVTISLGPEQVKVPEVYGLSLTAAQTKLANAELNSTPFEVEGNEPAGTALSTDPGAGALLDPDSTVTLYYSAGPPPETTASPEASASPEPEQQDQGEGNADEGSADDEPTNDANEPNGRPEGGNSGPGNSGPGKGGFLENVRENAPKAKKDRRGKKEK
jgi:eukaryotic-like serine/threonine-protein kinase